MSVPPGYVVGPWRVTELLATGSWSSVYAAESDGEPRTAALKVVPTGTLTQRQLAHLAELIGREVRAYERLEHSGLIRLYGVHVVDDPARPELDGATVLAMERASRSAADALSDHEGGLPDAPRIVAEVAAALAYLHEAGWVHGDLKPGNVLLMDDGSVRLADFGLATELTGTHAYLPPGGSTDYLPPERWAEELGDKGVAVRQTADVWALGVTAYELFTGRLPFPGVTSRARAAAAASYAAGQAQIAWPEDLPQPWSAFIADCLQPTHDLRRQNTAADLARRGSASLRSRVPWRRAAPVTALVAMVVAAGTTAVLVGGNHDHAPGVDDGAYFRTDADIPPRYYDLIVKAGTSCPQNPAVRPLLIAALLKAETNFDPTLSDPVKDEYGIARWTPSVLQYYLPAGERATTPRPPFPPEMSIPAVGAFMCRFAPELEMVPGDPMVNLAATYRTSATRVREAHGVPDTPFLRTYMPRFRAALAAYRLAGSPALATARPS